jgi:DMSO/TMAO reductase YedYZ molybdopterin-dependent catalytic subunit
MDEDRKGPAGNRPASRTWKGGRTVRHLRLLLVISILLLLVSVGLFVTSLGGAGKVVLSVGLLKGMQPFKGTYRSINRWKTIENTSFQGVPTGELLRACGAGSASSSVKIIASDGYFWPAVGKTLTVAQLSRKNKEGLPHILAYDLKGKALDPEPDGTGPVRYVAPQYRTTDMNKPSWVSNVRVIEVRPFPKGFKAPDPKKVPIDQVWVVGDVGNGLPGGRKGGYIAGGLGLALLLLVIGMYYVERRRRVDASEKPAVPPVAVLLALALVAGLVLPLSLPARSVAATSKVFSLAELKAMPAFAGHFTFLKQLPPYTYYEADYKGVPISTLLEQQMRLDPGASGVKVKARDGYDVTLTIDQVRATYPNGLKAIIAYEKSGRPLSDDEGPLRLIVPQNHPGSRDSGGDPNTPNCERMACSIEVSPVPAGVQAPATSSIPSGSLAVYGAGSESAPTPQPAPAPQPAIPTPAPQPAAQPASSPASQPQAQLAADMKAQVVAALNSPARVATYGGSLPFTLVLPAPLRGAMSWLFQSVGTK